MSEVTELVQAIRVQLGDIVSPAGESDLRIKVLQLVRILKKTRNLNREVLKEGGIIAGSARECIRLYLIRYVGTVLDAAELEVVGGISEYARRIRELRVEDGYNILCGPMKDEASDVSLMGNQYLLVSKEPDLTAARRWRLANRIRREEGGARGKILRYLKENVGQPVSTQELAYVGGINNYQRRVRELRTEDGYSIKTKNTGRPDLKPGEYVLESADRVMEPHYRTIPDDVQKEVYERDGYACTQCGWKLGARAQNGATMLEMHHKLHHVDRGPNDPDNLELLCNACHDKEHSRHSSG